MVEVPRHMSRHERIGALPLVTRQATVTAVEAMDRSRNNSVLAAIRERLADVGCGDLLGQVRDGADYHWDALWRHLDDAGVSKRRLADLQTLAERFERPYPSLIRLRVRPDVDVDFAPGQYVTLRARGTPRAYSVANAPSEDELEFAIRRVPGGRLTSNLYSEIEVGDEVVVRGPNGDMVLDSPSRRDVVFLATGTGVAPFKSMVDALYERGWDVHQGQDRHVWVFLGCAWEDDLPYREAFRRLADERERFHFVPTLTREPLLTDWDGETDYVQEVLLKYVADDALAGVDLPHRLARFRDADPATDESERIDPEHVELYACGVTRMVETLVETARAIGVPEKCMEYEGFG